MRGYPFCERAILQAMVRFISSNGWLSQALLAMDVSQMVTQVMCECDSMLLLLPHLTKELAKRCQEKGSDGVRFGRDGG